jgi:hypothetical protein
MYMDRLSWMKQNDPVHKKIMQIKDAFVNNDNFDPQFLYDVEVREQSFYNINKLNTRI